MYKTAVISSRPNPVFATGTGNGRTHNGGVTSTMKIRDELLTCRMCGLGFHAVRKRPLALHCLHTFCEECLSTCVTNSPDNSKKRQTISKNNSSSSSAVVCPVCDRSTPLGHPGRVHSLPVNPQVMELLEILASKKNGNTIFTSPSSSTGSKTTGNNDVTTIVAGRSSKRIAPEPPSQCVPSSAATAEGKNGINVVRNNGHRPDETAVTSMSFVSLVSVGSGGPRASAGQSAARRSSPQSVLAGPASTTSTPTVLTYSHTGESGVAQRRSVEASEVDTSPPETDSDVSAGSGQKATSSSPALCTRCRQRPAVVTVASSSSKATFERLCSTCSVGGGTSQIQTRISHSSDQIHGKKTAGEKSLKPENESSSSELMNKNGVGQSNTLKKSKIFIGSGGVRKSSADHKTTSAKDSAKVDKKEVDVEYQPETDDVSDRLQGMATTAVVNDSSRAALSSQSQMRGAGDARRLDQVTAARTTADCQRCTIDIGEPEIRRTSNDVDNSSSSRPSSEVPQFEDIYPPPCDNPPFNPDYDYFSTPETAPSDLGLPACSPPPPFDEKAPAPFGPGHRHIDGITGQRVPLSFVIPGIPGRTQPQQPGVGELPPKYEEVVMNVEKTGLPAPSLTQQGWGSTPDNGSSEKNAATRPCKSFGKYSEVSTQPGAFRAPTRISTFVTPAAADQNSNAASKGLKVVVTDRSNGTVQVFSDDGECLSMLRVLEVNGACLWTTSSAPSGGYQRQHQDVECLVAGTDRGIEVYDINGPRLDVVPLGHVNSIVRYQTAGFIAVQSRTLSFFKPGSATGRTTVQTRTLTAKAKPGQYSRYEPFEEICDVAVNSQQDLVVLESQSQGGASFTIMTEEGFIKTVVKPTSSDPSGPLTSPLAIAVDLCHNVFVVLGAGTSSNGGKVVMFGANGRYRRDVVEGTTGAWPAGVAVGNEGEMYVAMRGPRLAEIRLCSYLP